MKINKIFSLAILAAAVGFMSSCSPSEEDDIFDNSAAERLNAASALYSARLTAQPNGWAMQLYPTLQDETPYGRGYLLLLRFHKNHVVDAAMQNSFTGNAYASDSSNWDVITDDGPVLSFNTHNNIIHTFSDPEDIPSTGTSTAPNDETGTGIGGDYEFIIVDAPEDASYMMLKGKKRGTYNLLTPVEEGVDYHQYLTDINNFTSYIFPSNSPTFDVVHYGDSIYKMEDAQDGLPNIYPYDQDAVIAQSFNPFLITKRGNNYYLRFRDAKTYNDVTVQDFRYDSIADRFISDVDTAYYISGDDPHRFFNQCLENGTQFQLSNSSDMSDSFKALYSALNDECRDRRETLNRINIVNNDGVLRVTFAYRFRSGSMQRNASRNFDYTISSDESGITLTYTGPEDDNASKFLEQHSTAQALLNALVGKFTVSAATTAFNLRTMKLTSQSDASSWFTVRI